MPHMGDGLVRQLATIDPGAELDDARCQVQDVLDEGPRRLDVRQTPGAPPSGPASRIEHDDGPTWPDASRREAFRYAVVGLRHGGEQLVQHRRGIGAQYLRPGQVVAGELGGGRIDLHGTHLQPGIQAGSGIGSAGTAQVDDVPNPGGLETLRPPARDVAAGGLFQSVAGPQHGGCHVTDLAYRALAHCGLVQGGSSQIGGKLAAQRRRSGQRVGIGLVQGSSQGVRAGGAGQLLGHLHIHADHPTSWPADSTASRLRTARHTSGRSVALQVSTEYVHPVGRPSR